MAPFFALSGKELAVGEVLERRRERVAAVAVVVVEGERRLGRRGVGFGLGW